jgi:tetratricopeptide (TPR) repeat protein
LRWIPRTLSLVAAWTAAAVIVAGCGDDRTDPALRAKGRDRAWQVRAERAESGGDLTEALTAYQDAARRFPTAAWVWAGRGRTENALGRHREAEHSFREAIRWDSTLVAERVSLAELALATGRVNEALTWIDGALGRGGGAPGRHALRGRILADAGRVTEAHKEIERALASAPDDVEVHVARAFLQLRSDSTTLAMVTLDGLAIEHPEDPVVFEARAEARRTVGDHDGAIVDLETALGLHAHRPRARLALARLLQDAERFPDASEHYRELLENNPNHPEALEGLGACSLALGDSEMAEAAFRRAIDSTPEFAAPYLALGKLVGSQGRTDEAITWLRKARARATDDPDLYIRAGLELAEIHLRLGEPGNALAIAEAILARVPGSAAARVVRGRALAAGGGGDASGDELERIASRPEATKDEILAWAAWLLDRDRPDDALDAADRVIEDDPADPTARVVRARALAAGGRVDAAERELHEVIMGPVPIAAAHLALAHLYLDAGRYPDAIFQAREGQTLAPDDPELSAVIGSAALELENFDAARAAFERQRTLCPASPKPWLNLGRVELRENRPAEAAASFRRARELDPSLWMASYLLGLAEDQAGRPVEAVAAYRSVLSNNERVAEAHNNLAWLLADRDFDPVLAEVHARRAIELQPDNPHALGTLGWAQYKNRRLDEAVVSLTKASRALPDDAMKHYMLGVVQFDRGERSEALHEIETALRLDPSFERSVHAGELRDRLGG